MNLMLRSKFIKGKNIFKIKFFISIALILILGSNWGNVPKNNTENVVVTNNTLESSYEEDKVATIYNIELLSSINESIAGKTEELNIENVDFEELLSAQEVVNINSEDALNTSAEGAKYAVKSEEAYTFGRSEGKKYVFLTFDDGPSANVTRRILDTLKKYDVKATFFVLGKSIEENPNMLKREIEEGHALANHTYTHDYKKLYPNKSINVELFSEELAKNQQLVKTVSGQELNMRVIRFPGGSFESWKGPMKEEIKNNGKDYLDWNVENGDGLKNNISVDEQLENIKRYTSWAENANKNAVILMHDAPAKGTTADALPQIIEYLKSKGYEFRTLK